MTRRREQPRLLDPGLSDSDEPCDQRESDRYAQVVVDQPGRGLDVELTYAMPAHLERDLRVGSYVLVPLAGRRVSGWVTGFTTEPPDVRIRPIARLLVDEPVFDERGLELARWMAEHYLCPLRDALRCLLPPGGGRETQSHVHLAGEDPDRALDELSRAPRQRQVFEAVAGATEALELDSLIGLLQQDDPSASRSVVTSALKALQDRGLVRVTRSLAPPRVRERRQQVARPGDREDWDAVLQELEDRAPRQAETLRELLQAGEGVLVADLSRSAVGALEEKGLVTVAEEAVRRRPEEAELEGEPAQFLSLTEHQQWAFEQIQEALGAGRYHGVLLHGVTGSGKTEVYLHAIASTLEQCRGAIVLVPEIALTPQMVGRFRARFGERLALLHSALSAGERYDEWARIERGDADLVVGARSAIFAPLQDIGVIVVDEENERAYKQESPPRYHAVEVAGRRARQHDAVLILGGATPSLESYHRARSEDGELTLCHLPERIDSRPLPDVEVIDLRGETLMGRGGTFSQRLLDALSECLARREQAMLFLNRRGFSTFVMCRSCGFTLGCPDCSVSLIYHHDSREMRCHHCDFSVPVPDECPACESEDIGFHGLGTERVADQIAREFDDASVLRMDRDTTQRKGAYTRILRQFAAGEADILIGTQMIAKGHDFPRVTLVGVLNADTGLNRPDFRASEHTFQLLTQVAGRAGRADRPGRVLVQTYNPDHIAITAASRHDYEAFYRHELAKRRENMYPPFARLINLTISDEDQERTLQIARRLAYELQERGVRHKRGERQFVGPAQAPLARLRGRYRYHLLLKGREIGDLRAALVDALDGLGDDAAAVIADVDPLDMM
ncbi:MAG: primosomal protein N' [Armatimonadota bacterium]|nr:primosomal protein N' [Armatimonadota bacterium]